MPVLSDDGVSLSYVYTGWVPGTNATRHSPVSAILHASDHADFLSGTEGQERCVTTPLSFI